MNWTVRVCVCVSVYFDDAEHRVLLGVHAQGAHHAAQPVAAR